MKEEMDGTNSKSEIIDASIIIGYLFEERFKELLDGQDNFLISTITLFEIKKKMLERKIPIKDVKDKIDFLKSISTSIQLTEEIAEKAAELAIEHNIPAADSLLYATAILNKAELITADNDFRGLTGCRILQS